MSSLTKRVVIGALAGPLLTGCMHRLQAHEPGVPALTQVALENGSSMVLHLARGHAGHLPLLVYATGDAGWRGKDRDVYQRLVGWGYPTAGFSAPDYVKHFDGEDQTTTPAQLARDYEVMIDAARHALALSESTSVILVGVSRGAGLSVVAAGQPAIRDSIDGVVAVGLTKEEEHVVALQEQEPEQIELYDYLPSLGSVPIAVIQSTHDNYLPAARARALFGADTSTRQFHSVDARNHSFSGGRSSLYEWVHAALLWMGGLDARGRGRP